MLPRHRINNTPPQWFLRPRPAAPYYGFTSRSPIDPFTSKRRITRVEDHSVVAPKLDAVFHPQSIAVVGASTRPGTVGNDIFRNLLFAEFNGSVYPVNPKAKSILGVHAYATLGRHSRRRRSGRADRARRGRARAWSTRQSPRASRRWW